MLRPQRLGRDEVLALGGDERVWIESEGLPLFVAEYLAAGDAEDGLLDARLAGTDELTRQVAGAAAVLGRAFDLDTIRATSGRSDEEVAGALEALVARGIMRERGDAYEFSHGRLRTLVYDEVSLARRRLLHRRAAAALEPTDVVRVAEHLRRAGDNAAAAERYAEGAEAAAAVLAHDEAIAQFEAALALGHPDPARLQERIGDLRTRQGDYPGALRAYDAAAATAPAARLEHKLGEVHLRRGEWGAARLRLEAAAADPELRPRALADLALLVHRSGNGDAGALAREARELAEAAGDRAALAQAHNLLGMLNGDPAEVERGLALAEALGDPGAQAAALNNLARLDPDPERAIALTERALALCGADRHREAALENNLADLHHAAGHPEEAMEHLRRAVTIFSEVGADEATRLPEIWKLVSW